MVTRKGETKRPKKN